VRLGSAVFKRVGHWRGKGRMMQGCSCCICRSKSVKGKEEEKWDDLLLALRFFLTLLE